MLTRRQTRFLATWILPPLVALIALGSFLAWELTTTPAPTPTAGASAAASASALAEADAVSLDAYDPDFPATPEQADTAARVIREVITWSQSEPLAQRWERLSSLIDPALPDVGTTPWQSMYGDIPGAWVEVRELGEPVTNAHTTRSISISVLASYTLHLPHPDGSEALIDSSALWVVTLDSSSTPTAVDWPTL